MKKSYDIKFQFDPERTGWTSVQAFATDVNRLLEGKGLQTEVIEDSKDDKLLIIDFIDKYEPAQPEQSLQKAFDNVAKANRDGK